MATFSNIAELVAKECGGLPLGIRTMARSMNKVLDVYEWTNALVLIQQQLFPNLQEIELVNCPYLTEIIADNEDEGAIRGDKDSLLSLPNLKTISLCNMPNLESICRGLLLCDSLIKLNKEGCPMLKMIPLSLPLLCDSSECTLRRLPTDIEWWASLDKNYPEDVKVLRHLLIKRSVLKFRAT